MNQLYWKHREAFDRLLESSGRIHKAQSYRLAGKLADMRGALDARRLRELLMVVLDALVT